MFQKRQSEALKDGGSMKKPGFNAKLYMSKKFSSAGVSTTRGLETSDLGGRNSEKKSQFVHFAFFSK